MKKAAIDIGTNSTRLYIAEVNGNIKRIEKHTIITRLGSSVDKERILSKDAIERNVKALEEYKKIIDTYCIEDIKAIATSAVRDASNRDEFLKIVKERTSIDVEVISGLKEAELGFKGASSVLEDERGIVIDIGGGSTEFIQGEKGRINVLKSVDIGAVRITEKFLNHSTITSLHLKTAADYIKAAISDTIGDIKKVQMQGFAGIGGTVTTLAAVDLELEVYDFERIHRYKLRKGSVDRVLDRFIKASLEDRKLIPGLQPGRADIITAGTLILKIIMEALNFESITVSECDNLDGLMMEIDK